MGGEYLQNGNWAKMNEYKNCKKMLNGKIIVGIIVNSLLEAQRLINFRTTQFEGFSDFFSQKMFISA
jgi:hypothetical protein